MPLLETRCEAESHETTLVKAIQLARDFTGRSKVLWLANGKAAPFSVVLLPAMKPAVLCHAIGESSERIAAIILDPIRADEFRLKRFLKRVRELASAEGAVLIWNQGSADFDPNDFELQPDLTCFCPRESLGSIRISGRADILAGAQ